MGNLPKEQLSKLAKYVPNESSRLSGTNSDLWQLIFKPEMDSNTLRAYLTRYTIRR
jgi:hypothetical protein